MPNPSRWGKAREHITIPVPGWMFDEVDQLRRVEDWGTVPMSVIELIAEALAARGIHLPTEPPPQTRGANAATRQTRTGAHPPPGVLEEAARPRRRNG